MTNFEAVVKFKITRETSAEHVKMFKEVVEKNISRQIQQLNKYINNFEIISYETCECEKECDCSGFSDEQIQNYQSEVKRILGGMNSQVKYMRNQLKMISELADVPCTYYFTVFDLLNRE